MDFHKSPGSSCGRLESLEQAVGDWAMQGFNLHHRKVPSYKTTPDPESCSSLARIARASFPMSYMVADLAGISSSPPVVTPLPPASTTAAIGK